MNEDDIRKLIRQASKGLTPQKEEDLILQARISNLRRYDGEQIQVYNQDMLNRMGDSVVRISKDPDLGQYLSRDTERQYGDEYWVESNAIEALKMVTTGDLAGRIVEDLSREEQEYVIANIKTIYEEIKRAGKGKASGTYLIALIKSKFASLINPLRRSFNNSAPQPNPTTYDGASQQGEDLNDGLNDDFGVSPDEEPMSYGRNPGYPQSFFDGIYERMRNIQKRDQIETLNYVKENSHRRTELTADDIENLFTNGNVYFQNQKLYAEFGVALGIVRNKTAVRDDVLRMALAKVRNMRGEYRHMISNPSSPLFNIDEDETMMPKGYAEISDETDNEISGKGLSFQKRMPFHQRHHIVGRGINELTIQVPKKRSKTRTNRKYYDKVYIDMERLDKGILFCKYISYNQPIPTLKTQQISNDCRDVIKDIINDKFNMKVFNMLKKPERRLIRSFANKFNYELDIDNDNEDEEFQQQFQVLLGQYEAGNNDEKVKTQLKSYVRLAIKEDLIPYREGLALLVELT